MNIERGRNRHSFTLESNGYRLVFDEQEPDFVGQTYSHYFGITSYDEKGNYASFGIGKANYNNSNDFHEAIEKQMQEVEEFKEYMKHEQERIQKLLDALDEFGEILPQIYLEDGIDTEKELRKRSKKQKAEKDGEK